MFFFERVRRGFIEKLFLIQETRAEGGEKNDGPQRLDGDVFDVPLSSCGATKERSKAGKRVNKGRASEKCIQRCFKTCALRYE